MPPLLSVLAAGPSPGGYAGPPPVTFGRLVGGWTAQPLLLAALLAAAGLYAAAVVRLHRRGDRWSPWRSASWAVGLATVAFTLMSGLAGYDDTLFSVHMAQHMLLTMIAPLPLALGAPVTLALRALTGRGRRGLLAVLHSVPARVLSFPLVGFALWVGSPFALYFSPIYEASLRSDTVHLLVHVHLLFSGCLFFWPILGLDPLPGRPPHWARILLLFLALPIHAFLGLAIMGGTTPIAGDYYAGLHRPWGGTLLEDQHLGGGMLWASGDAVALLLLFAVLAQWMRADERLARREDRRLDRLEEQEAAYNARLAALAAADVPAGSLRGSVPGSVPGSPGAPVSRPS